MCLTREGLQAYSTDLVPILASKILSQEEESKSQRKAGDVARDQGDCDSVCGGEGTFIFAEQKFL